MATLEASLDEIRQATQIVYSCADLSDAEKAQSVKALSNQPTVAVVVANLPADSVAAYLRSVLPKETSPAAVHAQIQSLLTKIGASEQQKQELLRTLERVDSSVEPAAPQREFSVEEMGTIRAAFSRFDKDNSGGIDIAELISLSRELGYAMSPAEAEDTLHKLDSNHNGTIEFNEFLDWWKNTSNRDPLSNVKMLMMKAKLAADRLHARVRPYFNFVASPDLNLPYDPRDEEVRVWSHSEFELGTWAKGATPQCSVEFSVEAVSPQELGSSYSERELLENTLGMISLQLPVKAGALTESVESVRTALREVFELVTGLARGGVPMQPQMHENLCEYTDGQVWEITLGLAVPPEMMPPPGRVFPFVDGPRTKVVCEYDKTYEQLLAGHDWTDFSCRTRSESGIPQKWASYMQTVFRAQLGEMANLIPPFRQFWSQIPEGLSSHFPIRIPKVRTTSKLSIGDFMPQLKNWVRGWLNKSPVPLEALTGGLSFDAIFDPATYKKSVSLALARKLCREPMGRKLFSVLTAIKECFAGIGQIIFQVGTQTPAPNNIAGGQRYTIKFHNYNPFALIPSSLDSFDATQHDVPVIRRIFERFDVDKDGFLNETEWSAYVEAVGPSTLPPSCLNFAVTTRVFGADPRTGFNFRAFHELYMFGVDEELHRRLLFRF